MSNKPRKQRTNDELRKVTNRLFYEWKMLTFCVEELLKGPSQMFENAFIESGAIHARNLVKFFYPFEKKDSPLQSSDVIADDFFQSQYLNEWKNTCLIQADILKYNELGGYANLQIAHIVYEEESKEPFVAHGHYNWQFSLIVDALQPVFEKFIDTISKETFGDRWIENLDEQEGLQWEKLKAIVNEKFRN